MSNPLNDLAPCPRSEDEATAEAIAKHLTAQAFLTGGATFKAAREAFKPGVETDPAKVSAYGEAAARLTDQFSTVYLLRALGEHVPDKLDEIVRGLWECWRDGGVMPELLYDWVEAWGISPHDLEQPTESEAA